MLSFKKAFFFLSLTSVFVCAAEQMDEETAVKRIHSHLFIKDPAAAVQEAQHSLKLYPQSLNLQLAYLKALCQKGEEVEAFEQFISIFKTPETGSPPDRLILEWLAWGVLNKGDESPLLMVRLYALLGAAFTQDARAIAILMKELQGSNAILRSLAVKLCAQYGDAPLKEELLRLLKEEKIWFVKLEVIQAIGQLRMVEAKSTLQEMVASSKTMAEEKANALIALAGMYETLSQEELSQLVNSDRAGLRQLAPEIVAHLDLKEGIDSLLPLLFDASPDVRISTMKTLGLLRISTLQGKPTLDLLKKNLQDSHPEVAIMAGWLATVLGDAQGKLVLQQWIKQNRLEFKRLAAAALSATGTQGSDLAARLLKEETDLYTRVNLAIGLIGQRKEIKQASEVLAKALDVGEKELWMWESSSSGLFQSLSPSKVRHREEIPQYPQMVDHLVKLDLLSILSIVKYPKTQEAVKKFLKAQAWGVTAAAAAHLLQEGDESALEIIRGLLEDSDEKVRIQAALILALLGGDPSAVKVLIAAYPGVDREMKMHILEALGHIGDASAVPFLVSLLKEPFQGLRVVAASALIQCLYH
jgi:HEAT repeat protein